MPKKESTPPQPVYPKENKHKPPKTLTQTDIVVPPTIGRIVIYRTDGRNGMSYELPAMITCTVETHPGDYPDGSKNPLPVPSSNKHVHLTVFTPGGFGTTVGDSLAPPKDDAIFKGADSFNPGSGTYVELDVPFFDATEESDRHATERTWRWPVITRPEKKK